MKKRSLLLSTALLAALVLPQISTGDRGSATLSQASTALVPMRVMNGTVSVGGKTLRTHKGFVLSINDMDLFTQKEKIEKLLTPDTVVVVDVRHAIAIKDGTLNLKARNLPKGIRSLIITNTGNNIKTIGKEFLKGYEGLNDITFVELNHVTTIEDYFLFDCIHLAKINLSGLSSVRKIGNAFINNSPIKQIDLSPLRNVKTIGSHFLAQSDFQSIDLSPLANVETVGSDFLTDCYYLEKVDMKPLVKLRSIDAGFLENCIGLKSVTGLKSDTHITIDRFLNTEENHQGKVSQLPEIRAKIMRERA
jgi:hypothetical protein